MGYSLNGEMQLLSRENGSGRRKRGNLRSDREGTAIRNVPVYQTIVLCKPCPHGLVWASMGFAVRPCHIPMALSLGIVYAFPYSGIYGIHFFRYYIYRYTVYRIWKIECRIRISYWESFSISNSYHYPLLPPVPFFLFFHSFISIFYHYQFFPFPQHLYTFCNCNSLFPIIINCYSLFQVSDPGAKTMRSIDCLLRSFEYVSRSSFCFGVRLYTADSSSRTFVWKISTLYKGKSHFLIHRPGANVLFVFTVRLHIVYSLLIDT